MRAKRSRPAANGAANEQRAAARLQLSGPHAQSAWRARRLADLLVDAGRAGLDPVRGPDLIIAPLGSSGPRGSRADRTCDRCDDYVAPRAPLYIVQMWAAPHLLVVGGLCGKCLEREQGGR